MRIQVTREDVDNRDMGRGYLSHCVVANAIRRTTSKDVKVYLSCMDFDGFFWDLPPNVGAFITNIYLNKWIPADDELIEFNLEDCVRGTKLD